MSKKYIIELIQMSDESLNIELECVTMKDFRKSLIAALKEQDRDTRHACAEACLEEEQNRNYIIHKDFHDICMNCRKGIEEVLKVK